MNLPAASAALTSGDIMESVLIKGDLAKLSEHERVSYYNAVCKSIGLNPLTRPFDYITLNGRLQLYAKRDACDQLRKIQNISLQVISAESADGIYTVHVKAKTPEGREDEDFGAVPLPDTTKGEIRANLILKAITKAKRRATLSICGLGFLDETEVEDIPAAAKTKPRQIALTVGNSSSTFDAPDISAPETAAPQPSPSSTTAGAADSPDLLAIAREAAMHGEAIFNKFYASQNKAEKARINQIGDELRGLMDSAK
jgi:hypothetical protein